MKSCIETNEGKPPGSFSSEIKAFVEWATKENIRFIESEKKVYSKEKWYAGTMDILAEKDGRLFIADVKTGKDIYPDTIFNGRISSSMGGNGR